MPKDRGRINQWMDQAWAGDREAYGRLAREMQDDLYRFALAQGLGGADAAEAVQEVLMRGFLLRQKWAVGSDAAAWLFGIALNVVREAERTRRRQRADGFGAAWLAQEASGPGQADSARQEDAKRLAAAIAGLPPRQREAFACRYLMELSIRDTAEVMGCAEGTVKAATAAALETLRQKLGLRE
jgi:RNA polymerase sigma-70 factor (ECF subfamily)